MEVVVAVAAVLYELHPVDVAVPPINDVFLLESSRVVSLVKLNLKRANSGIPVVVVDAKSSNFKCPRLSSVCRQVVPEELLDDASGAGIAAAVVAV